LLESVVKEINMVVKEWLVVKEVFVVKERLGVQVMLRVAKGRLL
jgi:hypothetical protein